MEKEGRYVGIPLHFRKTYMESTHFTLEVRLKKIRNMLKIRVGV